MYISESIDLMADWDFAENAVCGLFPDAVSTGSRARAHWKCHVCGGKWSTIVKERRGCPYCSGFKALSGFNDLASRYPDLAAQWDSERNTLSPTEVTAGSQKKAWWRCEKGHVWDADVRSRVRGQGCPYCSNRRVLAGYNDLETIRPDLTEEWNWQKNGKMTPRNIIAGSKQYVWWKCCEGHEWRAQVHQRNRGTGCPVCSNRKAVEGYNDFSTKHPELLREWDYGRNDRPPYEYFSGSPQKVWWICKRGHSWKAAVSDRCKGNGCQKCSEERRVSFPEKTLFYYLAKVIPNVQANARYEWLGLYELDIYIPQYKLGIEYDGVYGHSTQTGVARDIRKNRVCQDHDIALIRVREHGCPKTNSTSLDYILDPKNDIKPAIAFIIDWIALHCDVRHPYPHVDIDRDSGEIYSLIERVEKENSVLNRAPNIARMWHPEKNGNLTPEYVSAGSQKMVWWRGECGHEWRSKVFYEVRSGKCPYCSGKRVLQGFNDLRTANPVLAESWNTDKNTDISIEEVTAGSRRKVWWRCAEGHEWRASIVSRNRGNGCPVCANRVVLSGYNDVGSNPLLSQEWDDEHNLPLTPQEVCVGSQKKFGWICRHCGYRWSARVSDRFCGQGCPRCAIKQQRKSANETYVREKGSLMQTHPELMREWDGEKNAVDPSEIIAGYGKKVWWRCSICHHSWEATVISRSSGRGCPTCGREKQSAARQATLLSKRKPISVTHAAIAKELDIQKNGGLTADQITAGSGRRIWWKCGVCGASWCAQVCERTRGRGKCPNCRAKKT